MPKGKNKSKFSETNLEKTSTSTVTASTQTICSLESNNNKSPISSSSNCVPRENIMIASCLRHATLHPLPVKCASGDQMWIPDVGKPLLNRVQLIQARDALCDTSNLSGKFLSRLDQLFLDEPISNQSISLFSFVSSPGARPDENGVFGFAKIRGGFLSEENANRQALNILQQDALHRIDHVRTGKPFPVIATHAKSRCLDPRKIDNVNMSEKVIQNLENLKKHDSALENQRKQMHEEKSETSSSRLEIPPSDDDPHQRFLSKMKKMSVFKAEYRNCQNLIAEYKTIFNATVAEANEIVDNFIQTHGSTKDEFIEHCRQMFIATWAELGSTPESMGDEAHRQFVHTIFSPDLFILEVKAHQVVAPKRHDNSNEKSSENNQLLLKNKIGSSQHVTCAGKDVLCNNETSIRTENNFPMVDRQFQDDPVQNQIISLFSFVSSPGARPDENGVFGFAKIRGHFSDEENAHQNALQILQHDSIHKIEFVRTGHPFPVFMENRSESSDDDLTKLLIHSLEVLRQQDSALEKQRKKTLDEKKKILELDAAGKTRDDPHKTYVTRLTKLSTFKDEYHNCLDMLTSHKNSFDKTVCEANKIIDDHIALNDSSKQAFLERCHQICIDRWAELGSTPESMGIEPHKKLIEATFSMDAFTLEPITQP